MITACGSGVSILYISFGLRGLGRLGVLGFRALRFRVVGFRIAEKGLIVFLDVFCLRLQKLGFEGAGIRVLTFRQGYGVT